MEWSQKASTENWFLWVAKFLVLFFLFLFLSRLVDLQIIRGAYFRELADQNRIRRIPILAPRGLILDKDGKVLVGNKDVKRFIRFTPEEGFKKENYDSSLAEESEIILEKERFYFLGSDFGHASGYISETTKEEVGKVHPNCPEKGPRKLSQFVGRTGLEEYFDCELLGLDGEEIIEVDSMGRKIRTLGRKMPTSGKDIKTNIDSFLQSVVSKNMEGKKGAVLVTDAKGKVLAIFSSPSYDPNVFVEGDLSKIRNYFQNKDLYLFNRAIGGVFHPGSVYKPLVGLAALSEGAIDTDFKFNDEGVITINNTFGTFSYSNWYFTQYGGKEGTISLARALARSTDTYFYKIGEFLGVDKLKEWSTKFDLDKKTGIELPGEAVGLVPSAEWKLRTKGERWFLGNTYHYAIGQGDLAVTPAEVQKMTVAIVNGGYLCDLKIVEEGECKNLNLSPEYLSIVHEGMRQACEKGGTAFPFFDFRSKVLCKTGTAETHKENITHAWFVVAYPEKDSRIIITVLIEEGGEGSKAAAPVARKILDEYLDTIGD